MGRSVTFSVTVLGSSGSYAAPDNPCTGYLLRSPGATVLLDCGPGTVGPLQTELDLLDLEQRGAGAVKGGAGTPPVGNLT